MKRIFLLFVIFSMTITFVQAQLPVKFDSLYKKIYARELCALAAADPGLVLIDVRTPGEYSDTSQYNSLNMGHLQSAINIPVDSIQKNIALMNPFKDKTIVLYCSHSQRSRRVSKLLAENGFTRFYNLNGGMSILNQLTEQEFPCKKQWLQSNLPYTNLSNTDAVALLKKEPTLIIVDIRPAALYHSSDSLPENNIGRLKRSVNIPFADWKERMGELKAFKNRPVVLYAQTGDGDAARAAASLAKEGFTRVYHLLAGFDEFIIQNTDPGLVDNRTKYHLVGGKEALELLQKVPGPAVYDTRTTEEFNNSLSGRDAFRNLGRIKNAVHLEAKNFDGYAFPKEKNYPVLVYGNGPAFQLATKLCEQGYKNVFVMHGLFGLIATAFNTEGGKDALKYLVNHDGIY